MRSIPCLIAITLAGLCAGCAGYKLGPSNGLVARERSVQIQPFYNQTLEPRLSDAVMTQLRRQLQRDGTFQLATRKDGDILVSGVLTHYDRRPISFISGDVETGEDYRLTLVAQVVARDRVSGKALFDRLVRGYTIIRAGNDLTSTERQALPLLAEELAKNITSLLADGSW